ncbi:hypothetical protein CH375_11485 [Leptospira ellisii]|uniref:Uncharacterized protein n=1 Tax=Leptospira ellisii TaxID=2023197 RepID=A0A2N0BC05_9LEPT|nr:hypothetical protein CH379_04610 [Leptospira ellisii]PKA04366.1 hypothetical protein CH375_11485 [Leptospira ellisii]
MGEKVQEKSSLAGNFVGTPRKFPGGLENEEKEGTNFAELVLSAVLNFDFEKEIEFRISRRRERVSVQSFLKSFKVPIQISGR